MANSTHMIELVVVVVGTGVAIVVATAATVWGFFRFRQGDPSEWRENYLAEVVRREDAEGRLHSTEVALAAEKAAKDITPLIDMVKGLMQQQQKSEERLTRRLETFEKEFARMNKQTSEVLTSLMDAVLGINKAPSRSAARSREAA